MLSYTLFKALTFPVTYLLVAVLVFTAVMQIRYLNRALQRFPSTQVIPTQFVLFTLSVILGSAVLYRDFERMQASNVGEFVGGCALTFSGVWLITSGRKPSDEDDDEDDDYDEDAEEVADQIRMVDEEQTPADGMSELSRTATAQTTTPFVMSTANSRRQSKESPETPIQSGFEYGPQTPSTTAGTDNLTPQPPSLTENPWALGALKLPQQGSTSQQQRPTLYASRSEPMLPLDSGPETPQTPSTLLTLPSLAAHSHGTSQSAAAHSHATPTAARTTTPAHLRNSFTEFVPGPLLTPLSSSLSAVVADSLRRGVDSASIRRRRSIARNRLPDRPSASPLTPNGTRARGVSEADLEAAAATVGTLPRGEEEADNLLPGATEPVTPSKSRRRNFIEASKSMFRKGKSKERAGDGEPSTPPV